MVVLPTTEIIEPFLLLDLERMKKTGHSVSVFLIYFYPKVAMVHPEPPALCGAYSKLLTWR